MIKLCVFDLDGTLADTLLDLATGANLALAEIGLPMRPVSDILSYIGNGAARLIRGAIGEENFTEEIGEKALELFKKHYAAHLTDKTRPYPGVSELVKRLNDHGVRCAIFTNKPDREAKEVARILFGKDAFVFVVGNRADYPRKPDGTALRVLLSALDIEKEDCLFVGDSDVDIATARSTGVKVAGVTWGFAKDALLAAGPDFVIDRADELLAVCGVQGA